MLKVFCRLCKQATREGYKTLMAIGTQDPVLGSPVMRQLQGMIRNCPEPLLLDQAGHFVQEHGANSERCRCHRDAVTGLVCEALGDHLACSEGLHGQRGVV